MEFTSSKARVRRPDEAGVIAQSNHFHLLPQANLPKGTAWTVEGMKGLLYEDSTESRFATADRLLHDAAGEITIETLKSIFRDHSAGGGVGSDVTLCYHSEVGSTLASILMDVGGRTMWVADGNPCQNHYAEVTF